LNRIFDSPEQADPPQAAIFAQQPIANRDGKNQASNEVE
jgi:hypothetical protein